MPFSEDSISRNYCRAALVALADDLEDQAAVLRFPLAKRRRVISGFTPALLDHHVRIDLTEDADDPVLGKKKTSSWVTSSTQRLPESSTHEWSQVQTI